MSRLSLIWQNRADGCLTSTAPYNYLFWQCRRNNQWQPQSCMYKYQPKLIWGPVLLASPRWCATAQRSSAFSSRQLNSAGWSVNACQGSLWSKPRGSNFPIKPHFYGFLGQQREKESPECKQISVVQHVETKLAFPKEPYYSYISRCGTAFFLNHENKTQRQAKRKGI